MQPGTFCWAELYTNLIEQARDQYTSMFRWSAQTTQFGTYIFTASSQWTAAARSAGHGDVRWLPYVGTNDLARSIRDAKRLGATALSEPFTSAAGQAAVMQDPGGAAFGLLQPEKLDKRAKINQAGALCWSELFTPQPLKAVSFYTRLCGWLIPRVTQTEAGVALEYASVSKSGKYIGRIWGVAPEAPARWVAFFEQADVQSFVERGGRTGFSLRRRLDHAVPECQITTFPTFGGLKALLEVLTGKNPMAAAEPSSLIPVAGGAPYWRYAVLSDARGAEFGIMDLKYAEQLHRKGGWT